MALIDVERAVLSICFAAEPPEAALRQLGERDRWLLYRELIRERLWREVLVALPRTAAAVGEVTLQRVFAEQLERDPPRTRFFYEIVAWFAERAGPSLRADGTVPSWACDLLRFEAALWEVSDLEVGAPPELREFAFDRVPVTTRALRLLALDHAVHRPPEGDGQYDRGPVLLAIHRAAADAKPQALVFNQVTFALLEDFCSGDATAAECVQRVAAKLGRQVTPDFVDGLCESLAQWMELGVLLGSR